MINSTDDFLLASRKGILLLLGGSGGLVPRLFLGSSKLVLGCFGCLGAFFDGLVNAGLQSRHA